MKAKKLFLCSHRSQCFGAVRLLVYLAVAVVLWPHNMAAQRPSVHKLTLSQVEELVSHHVPDSTMGTEIQRRGLAFAPSSAIVESLRAKGAGPQTLAAVEALLPKTSMSAGNFRTQTTLGSGFKGPWAVAVDGSGNVFVVDSSLKEILAGDGYSTVKEVCTGHAIFGVAVDKNGDILLAGPGFNEVNVIDPTGCATVKKRLPGTTGFAVSVALDGSGDVFLADNGRPRYNEAGGVRQVPFGCASTSCVKTLGGGFNSPRGVAVDKRGTVFVADTGNSAVKKIPRGCMAASCVESLGGGFNHPFGIAIDSRGNLFVADTYNNAVKEIPSGCVSAICIESLGSGFNQPWGVAVDRNDDLFIADRDNDRVVKLDYARANAEPKPLPTATQGVQNNETSAATEIDKTFIPILERDWNFYVREKLFLGPTYFGNTTSFGRHQGTLHALALMSDYPAYRALALKGLITLSELSLSDVPASVYSGGGPPVQIERAATVALTRAGADSGDMDNKANTVTFVLGTYRVEKITLNTAVETSKGQYRLLEGTYVLDIDPKFDDLWGELGWPKYRDRQFRIILKYDSRFSQWTVAPASNGRFAAEDIGPRGGSFESENVPPTLGQLRMLHR